MADRPRRSRQDRCCPILRAFAMVEELRRDGVQVDIRNPVYPLIIARLRAEYDCPGPAEYGCPLERALPLFSVESSPDGSVPILDRRKTPGQFL